MNHLEQLGAAKQLKVKLDTQGNVLLWRDQVITAFPLTPEEALELRFWLEQQHPNCDGFSSRGVLNQALNDRNCRTGRATMHLLPNTSAVQTSQPHALS